MRKTYIYLTLLFIVFSCNNNISTDNTTSLKIVNDSLANIKEIYINNIGEPKSEANVLDQVIISGESVTIDNLIKSEIEITVYDDENFLLLSTSLDISSYDLYILTIEN